MKRKCAFCDNDAESGEHLWDDWINKRLPKKTKFNSSKRLAIGSDPIKFVSSGLNEKIPVVCTPCNSGWMSEITSQIRQRFSETILSQEPTSLAAKDAALLAAFAFMKAAVKDYCYSGDDTFFSAALRSRFKDSLSVPPSTRMWIAAYEGGQIYIC
jgi:hypothetical protein